MLLSWHAGSNPPPANDTATGWEAFVNHTHILDEFVHADEVSTFVSGEVVYDENHPDFTSACELGQKITRLWALKLYLDFPSARFRVYYTQYDNPIVRFHKVRDDEPQWLSEEALLGATDPAFRSALIYDTSRINSPNWKHLKSVH